MPTADAAARESDAPSYVQGATTPALLKTTIGDCFEAMVRRQPDRPALVSRAQDRRWTYQELDAAVDDFARGLSAIGLKKGDRIGIWSPNNAEWVITQFATAKLGLILVTINPAYRTHEL